MGEVVALHRPSGGKSYRVEFVLFEGRKRRQWAVVETGTDGRENYLAVSRGRKSEAEFMANVWTRVEADRQKHFELFQSHPLGQLVLKLEPEQREVLTKFLEFGKRLRS